jgi:hypothetical protein
MVIAAVIGVCVLVAIIASVVPRLSHHAERGGKKPFSLGSRGAWPSPVAEPKKRPTTSSSIPANLVALGVRLCQPLGASWAARGRARWSRRRRILPNSGFPLGDIRRDNADSRRTRLTSISRKAARAG